MPSELACQLCGRVDSTIRFSVFTWVASIVLFSWRKKVPGIWCDQCRRRTGRNYALRTLLLGPWGIPFGIIWSLIAFADDLRGGEIPKDVNANLLSSVGILLLHNGEILEGIRALQTSLTFRQSPEVSELLARASDELELRQPDPQRSPGLFALSRSVSP